ncbi:ABC transporter permease [Oceanicola sp. D3]|uniref:ABC transporter permease n=1 Tax=Oceanicola sp. D3 TaxID=2587163 RepID=UPI00111D4CE5|nr:ABC transporter permease [Oceanicola sp. D3]QDC10044.1 ABC transporter permease [Oceanicola sp. D3]
MKNLGHRIWGYLLVAALLVLWEVSARLIVPGSTTWPPFTTVLSSLVTGLLGGELLYVVGSSLFRMGSGFVIGSTLGVVLGLAMGLSTPLRQMLGSLVEIMRPIPAAAIIPPLIFILGIDDALKVFVVSLAVFFPVVINTLSGTLNVETTYLDVARTFGVNRLRTVRRVVLPAVMPYVFAGMRTSLAIALITTVVAEMIAGSGGIGYYIINMQYAMRPGDMYAAVIVLSLLGYTLNQLFRLWERNTLAWSRK